MADLPRRRLTHLRRGLSRMTHNIEGNPLYPPLALSLYAQPSKYKQPYRGLASASGTSRALMNLSLLKSAKLELGACRRNSSTHYLECVGRYAHTISGM
jgi:hypothetical protein